MKKYEYMVIYLFPNGNGRTFITRNKKIKLGGNYETY